MGPERSAYRKITLTNEEEKNFFVKAVADFTGSDAPINLQFNPVDNSYRVLGLPERDIAISFVEYQGGDGDWTDPFFNFLFNRLSDEEKQALLKFSQSKGRIVSIRRTRPGKEFMEAIRRHGRRFHQGALSLTEISLISNTNNLYNGTPPSSQTEEEQSLEELFASARNTIKFYPLTEDEKVRTVMQRINQLSDPYELGYNILLTIRKITRDESLASALAILLGIPFEKVLEITRLTFGEQTSQVLAQMLGEVVAMISASGDRVADAVEAVKIKDKGNLIKYFGLVGQAIKHLPGNIKASVFSQAEFYQKARKILAQRLIVIGITLLTTIFLSWLSQRSSSLLPYAVIPTLNSIIINAYEVYERAKLLRGIRIADKDFEDLLKKIPPLLGRVFRRLPKEATVAFTDWGMNKYAVGGLVGAFAATLLVLPLEQLGVSRDWIYSISGLMAENAVALLWGRFSTAKDPYRQFVQSVKNLS